MATIDARTGQVISPDAGTRTMADLNGASTAPAQTPYAVFMNNMTGMLKNAQQASVASNAALGAQRDALARGETFLGSANPSNPLSFLYNMETPSGSTASQAQTGQIFEPGITSIQTQQENNAANMKSAEDLANTQISAYKSMKPNWTLAPQPNADGEWYYYNTNVAPGQPPQQYPAGKIPPGVGGSPGGSPASADHTSSLAASHNPFGIKMTGTTTDMFSGLGAIPGPAAADGGNFWSFPDDSTGEKAARTLLTSPLYANDSVDQALRQWSNYTGTGKYPGYNGDILKGTGIDPNATIKSLSSQQVDVVLGAMKKAEAVTAISSGQPGNLMDQAAQQVASGVVGFDDAFSSLNGLYNGKLTKTQFIGAVQKIRPDFNVNQSNAQAAGTEANVKNATTIKPLIEKTNAVIDGSPALNGAPATEGILDKFDRLPALAKSGSNAAYEGAKGFSSSTGVGSSAFQDYERALSELRANANSVLNSAVNLGVVTGRDTADSLFPPYMTRDGLLKAIQTIKGYELQMYQKLSEAPSSATASQAPQAPAGGGSTYRGITLPN